MVTKKTTKKKAKPVRRATKKKAKSVRRAAASPASRRFRREDIPGIVPGLRDMKDPYVFAEQRGVPLSSLRAFQVPDPARGGMLNDFEVT